MFNKFNNYSISPVALFALNNWNILYISSLEAGGKSKLKESGKTFSLMIFFS